MSLKKTEFTIEKAKNGYILDNKNTGKNVFTDKEGISSFVANSLVASLNYNNDETFNIKIEIEKMTLEDK